jgi:hypothetical protein
MKLLKLVFEMKMVNGIEHHATIENLNSHNISIKQKHNKNKQEQGLKYEVFFSFPKDETFKN